jgi:tRNA U54 and U55 pseudouridine synthase Pus10
MVRINPGSNVHGDNKTGTALPAMHNVNYPEPIVLEKDRLQCPICENIFDSREDYISHAMARHQPEYVEKKKATETEFECTT